LARESDLAWGGKYRLSLFCSLAFRTGGWRNAETKGGGPGRKWTRPNVDLPECRLEKKTKVEKRESKITVKKGGSERGGIKVRDPARIPH